MGGLPRFADDPETGDTGCGEPVQVDIGAHEYQGEPVKRMCYADATDDGIVGFADVLEVLSAWGEYGETCRLGDLDLSGTVDFGDLLIVLAAWGPCE